jgi:hypothetical protein
MASIATDTTDDIGCDVSLFGAIVFTVTNLTAVLACLILVVTKCTVERSKLT